MNSFIFTSIKITIYIILYNLISYIVKIKTSVNKLRDNSIRRQYSQCAGRVSNPQPPVYKTGAHPFELPGHVKYQEQDSDLRICRV